MTQKKPEKLRDLVEPTDVEGDFNPGESADRPRKERVLHTRVPAVLEEELKRLATSLRLPVSNLVRTILEDAVDAVDLAAQRAEGGLRGFGDRLAGERERLRERVRSKDEPDPLHGVLGFQPFVLASDTRCAKCKRALAAGQDAFLGVGGPSPTPVVVGRECVPGAKSPATHSNQEEE